MREARYWSRPAKPVEGMLGCWARAGRAQRRRTQIVMRYRMAEMLSRVDRGTAFGGRSALATRAAMQARASRCSAERERRPFPHAACRYLHSVIIWTAAAFRWHPGDDLVWVGDVAGFAVDAIGRVQADALAVGLGRIVDHFVDIGGAEILAGTAEFLHAARVANTRVVDNQVRGLVFFVLGAGVVEVGELVEGKFAVALGGAE